MIDENINQCVEVKFAIEDLINSYLHSQSGLFEVNAKYDELIKHYELEQSKRTEFIANFPTKIETIFSKETNNQFEKLWKKVKRMERFIWTGIGVIIFAVLIMIISINFSTNWYKESIKAKSELRADILNEIDAEGKKIYNEREIKILQENTKILQLWIQKDPKKAEDFLKFKDGYEAGKTEK